VSYLYETHLHTREASSCALASGAEYIRSYLDRGFTGIIVTDHFYNGNSPLSGNLPWKDWVALFCRGYEHTRQAGERQGLDVFFGWEETFDGDDYLVYGLDKTWLLEHPEVRFWNRREQFEQAGSFGGCVVQAHPFRDRYYIQEIHLSTGCVDAVEAANAGNDRNFDALAMRYAQKLGLPVTAGSDIHNTSQAAQGALFGVYLDKKMESIQDYVQAIKTKAITRLHIPPGRCDYQGNEDRDIAIPVDIRDAQDNSTGLSLKQFYGRG
jgi:hypothetical protein